MICEVSADIFPYFNISAFSFRLHPFPSLKRQPIANAMWKKMINRTSPSNRNRLFTVKTKMRVCSDHFIDKKPTFDNSHPTLMMGYQSSPQAKKVLSPRRKITYKSPLKKKARDLNQQLRNHRHLQ